MPGGKNQQQPHQKATQLPHFHRGFSSVQVRGGFPPVVGLVFTQGAGLGEKWQAGTLPPASKIEALSKPAPNCSFLDMQRFCITCKFFSPAML
jgi:hypothetical protein